tara:strand:+ start:8242 stop:9192 length:951 start_codon:yes stop_codon:yes gene_type:complete
MSNNEDNLTQTQEQKVEETTANPSSPTQEDIFNEVFGDSKADEFVAKVPSEPSETVESGPSDVQDVSEQGNEADSYKYWQSQADKRQAELDALKSQVADIEDVMPIARHLKRNPEIIQNLASQANQETVEPLQRPVKPKKPADYDHSEALADPESDSGKYLSQREAYMDGVTDYMDKQEAIRQEQLALQQQAQMQQARDNQVSSELQGKHGMSASEAQQFINEMSRPESLTLDNLVKLHKINTGQGVDTTQVSQSVTQVTEEAKMKQQTLNNRKDKLEIPRPIGVQPGASVQSSKSVEDNMMDSMINNFNKKNPFQ